MQARQIRILVLDIDETAYCSLSTREDKLSQAVIDIAIAGNYNGLYGCTHRSYLTLDFCKLEALRIAADHGKYDFQSIVSNFATSKVLPRFAEVTGLPLHAISMVDDVLHEKPGLTYETLIKPLEERNERARSSTQYLAEENVFKHWHTKNPQLTQIAKHARELYTDAEIVLDFIDDRKPLCEKALNAHLGDTWPAKVSINAFHCDYVNGSITPVVTEPVTSLKNSGVFTAERKTEKPQTDENDTSLAFKA